jgi:D-alanine transaminase
MSCVFLNGEYLAPQEAKISALDRGFIFGDGVYEVIPAYGRNLFRLEPHLQRLDNSLAGIRMQNPYSRDEWREILNTIIQKNDGDDQSVYLQITRGVSKRDHAFPDDATPTVFVMSNPLTAPSSELLHSGISAITVEDIRWRYCHIKSIALLPNILLRQQACDEDAHEAIMHRDNIVTEGAASNVFIVKDGNILTPRSGEHLLPGITRDLVLELAAQHKLEHGEADITLDELRHADEIWLTSSTKEVLPVTRLDNEPVADGKPGKVWRQMITYYQACKKALQQGQAC